MVKARVPRAKKTKLKKLAKKRLVILDAHAIIHRAYHALPDFVSSSGEPTGALYGLSSMLIRVADELEPDYVVACVDRPEETHRHQVFDGYKATRVKAEDDLIMQLNKAREVFDAFNIPVYDAAGFEADDCIGTIVRQVAHEKDLEVVIATGDYDTLQLVHGTRVRVFTLRTGLTDTVTFDEEAVRARFGFGPEHVTDYKGLRGDPSDNIPGIRGVGEKTATELIMQFGSLEEIYETLKKHPEKFEAAGIKPRIMNLLRDGEDDAVFSKMLATIKMDVPITFVLPQEVWRETFALEKLIAFFDAMDFRSLIERAQKFFGDGAEEPETAEDGPAEVISETLFATNAVDAHKAHEAAIALWLLHSDFTNPTIEDVLRYAATKDVAVAYTKVMEEIAQTGRLQNVFEEIERPLIPVVERMCNTGITLDTAYLQTLSTQFHKELAAIRKRVFTHAGHEFNINSPRQLGTVLFDEMHIEAPSGRIKKTATGQRSTREEELEKMKDAHPIIADVLEYRGRQKLLSTYVDALPGLVAEDGRLHATFLQAGSTTGRMSSQNPNLQNIPAKDGSRIRQAFVAAKKKQLIALDYSQIELRIAAGLSGDTKLAEVFKEDRDIHTAVASDVFHVSPGDVTGDMRRKAKVINFGILYGMGVNALRANLGEDTPLEEARKYLARYFENYTGLAQFMEDMKQKAARDGFTETLFGRRRYFAGIDSAAPQVRAQAERMAINAPIQGTQADIIKKAMVDADAMIEKKKWRGKVELVLQIHDELVYEVDDALVDEVTPLLKSAMQDVVAPQDLNGVPITVTTAVGKNFGEMEK